MKIVKGVFVYTLIILGILLVIGMLVFGCMFLFPGFKVFGWAVLNKNHEVNKAVDITTASISSYDIVVNAGVYDVNLVLREDGSKNISAIKTDDMLGLYKPSEHKDTEEKNFWDLEAYPSGKKIIINCPDVKGAFSPRKSSIKILVPNNSSYSLTVVSSSGDVYVGGISNENPISLTGLNISTKSGNFSFNNIYGTNNENFTRYNFDFLDLTTVTGEFNLGNSTSDNVIYVNGNANLTAERGEFRFPKLLVKDNLIIKGTDILVDAKELKSTLTGSKFEFNAPNGYFKIKSLAFGSSTIVTRTINIDIESVEGTLSIITTYGNISLKTLSEEANLSSTHGDIKIEKALDSVSVRTEYGDINVKYQAKAFFKNNHGITDVEFVTPVTTETGVDKDNLYNYTCNISTGDGTVYAKNLMFETKIVSNNGGKINADFVEMYIASAKENTIYHEIVLNGGKANIKVARTKSFMFMGDNSKGGTINGLVGETTSMGPTTEYVQKLTDSTPGITERLAHMLAKANSGTITFSTYVAE